ncbi:hypothetical protein DKZ23_08685, partial [Limosilactobacillus reuteri]
VYHKWLFYFSNLILQTAMTKNMQKMALMTSAVLAGIVLGADINQKTVHADTTNTNSNVATATDEQAQAQQAVDQAQTKLDNAKQSQTTAQNQVAQATDTQNKVQQQVNDAQTAVNNDQQTENQAQQALDNSNKLLDQAQQQAQNTVDSAQNDVNNAQATVNNDQQAVKDIQNVDTTTAQQNFDKAQSDLTTATQNENNAKSALDQAQTEKNNADNQVASTKSALDKAQQDSEQTDTSNTKINLPAGYDWNNYAQYKNEIFKVNHFVNNPADEQITFTLGPGHYLPKETVKDLSIYAAQLWNPIRKQFGLPEYTVNDGAIEMAMEHAKESQDGNLVDANNILSKFNVSGLSRTYTCIYPAPDRTTHRTVSLNDLKKQIFNSALELLIADDGRHLIDHDTKSISYQGYQQAIGIDVDNKGQTYWYMTYTDPTIKMTYLPSFLAPNKVYDPNGKYAQLAKTTYDVPAVSDTTSHTVDPSVLTNAQKAYNDAVSAQQAAATRLEQAKTAHDQAVTAKNDVQAKFDAAQKALDNAKADAQTQASNLKAAQDKLAQDQDALAQAKSKLNTAQTKLADAKNAHDEAVKTQTSA